jgi:hypothetical protein
MPGLEGVVMPQLNGNNGHALLEPGQGIAQDGPAIEGSSSSETESLVPHDSTNGQGPPTGSPPVPDATPTADENSA